MRTTVAIPCSIKHYTFLSNLLSNIMNGTILPDEICIAIGGICDKLEVKRIKDELGWAKNLKLLFSDKKMNAAESRDFITREITGDIVIYQDADDLMHPQRIEIVKRFFQDFNIVHLCHSFSFYSETVAGEINYNEIKYESGDFIYDKYFTKDKNVKAFGEDSSIERITAGATCVKKSVLEDIKWVTNQKCPEDKSFCMSVLKTFNKTLLIDAPIYIYRK